MAGEMKKVAGVMAAYKVVSDLDQLKSETEKIKKIHQAQLEEAENLSYEAKRQNEILEEHNEEMKKMERARLELVQEEAHDAKEARSRKELLEYVDRCASKGYGANCAILVKNFYDDGHLLSFDILIERIAKLPFDFIKMDSNQKLNNFLHENITTFEGTSFWELFYETVLNDNCENIMDIAKKKRDEYRKELQQEEAERQEAYKKVLENRHQRMAQFISSLIDEAGKQRSTRKNQLNSQLTKLEEEKQRLEKSISKLLKIKSIKAAIYTSYLCIGLIPILVYLNHMRLSTASFVLSIILYNLYKLITLPIVKKEIQQLDEKIAEKKSRINFDDEEFMPNLISFITEKFYFYKYHEHKAPQWKVFKDLGLEVDWLSKQKLDINQKETLKKNLNKELNQQILTHSSLDLRIHATVVKIWDLSGSKCVGDLFPD